jgi:hypothetical protein
LCKNTGQAHAIPLLIARTLSDAGVRWKSSMYEFARPQVHSRCRGHVGLERQAGGQPKSVARQSNDGMVSGECA